MEVERPPLRPIVSGSHHGVYAHTGRLPRAEIRLGKGMCDPNQRETVTERGLASGTSGVCDNWLVRWSWRDPSRDVDVSRTARF